MLAQKRLRAELGVHDDVLVRGDAFLLHLALSNLIENAIEFSPRDSAIQLHCERVQGEVRVSIEDGGPGIPDYAKARIFERFYSLERPDTGRKSTGLGLNFVQEIAALHHGSVQLENRSERGLRARFAIPTA
jgi:two-component system sensor histidine kinase CreC